MTPAETGKIMDILKTAYPRFYVGPNTPDIRKTVGLWAEMFRDDDVAIVAAAVKALIESDEKGFPPHIGAVKDKIRLLTNSGDPTEAEAWALVAEAIRNSAYEAKKEFDKLPPNIRRLVGSPNQLRQWSMMESDTVHSVVASNFQRSYRVIAQREREISKLPPDVKKLITRLSDAKKMKELPETEAELPEIKDNAAVPAPEDFVDNAMNPGTGRSREDVLRALRGMAM